jgi:hypothetical protein
MPRHGGGAAQPLKRATRAAMGPFLPTGSPGRRSPARTARPGPGPVPGPTARGPGPAGSGPGRAGPGPGPPPLRPLRRSTPAVPAAAARRPGDDVRPSDGSTVGPSDVGGGAGSCGRNK